MIDKCSRASMLRSSVDLKVKDSAAVVVDG